jgi:hypothetical protein
MPARMKDYGYFVMYQKFLRVKTAVNFMGLTMQLSVRVLVYYVQRPGFNHQYGKKKEL